MLSRFCAIATLFVFAASATAQLKLDTSPDGSKGKSTLPPGPSSKAAGKKSVPEEGKKKKAGKKKSDGKAGKAKPSPADQKKQGDGQKD